MKSAVALGLCILIAIGAVVPAAAEPDNPVAMEYTSYEESVYPPKGRYFQIFEDTDLENHKRPIRKIGKLRARVPAEAQLNWEQLENRYAAFCRKKGADAVINMRYSHDVDEPVQAGDEMWIESELIVYIDQEQYGHVGFWYHNNRPEIPGVRVEMVVRGSPAEEAGILPGDIVKGISGESTGTMNIAGKDDYREAKYKFRANQEYQFYIERNGQPKLLTVIPRADTDVYNWDEQFGGL